MDTITKADFRNYYYDYMTYDSGNNVYYYSNGIVYELDMDRERISEVINVNGLRLREDGKFDHEIEEIPTPKSGFHCNCRVGFGSHRGNIHSDPRSYSNTGARRNTKCSASGRCGRSNTYSSSYLYAHTYSDCDTNTHANPNAHTNAHTRTYRNAGV